MPQAFEGGVFVTVGAQMPFDRLVRAVDAWAGVRGRTDVFAQIGPDAAEPSHLCWTRFLEPPEFEARVRASSVIVAHAGMGSIITALRFGKPILVMPRRESLRETRNDHQVATAERFASMGRVSVAMDEHELTLRLDALGTLEPGERVGPHASSELVSAIRRFIHEGIAR